MRSYAKAKVELRGTGKFAPKLTFEERCGLYYAGKIGIPDWAILKVAKIHRSSLTRLLDGKHKAYLEVREKYQSLGHEEFGHRYYTEELQQRIAAAQGK